MKTLEFKIRAHRRLAAATFEVAPPAPEMVTGEWIFDHFLPALRAAAEENRDRIGITPGDMSDRELAEMFGAWCLHGAAECPEAVHALAWWMRNPEQ